MSRSKFLVAVWVSILTLLSMVALTTTASAQSCTAVCSGQGDGTSCSCADVSPADRGECVDGTCVAAGIYILETTTINGSLGSGCTSQYERCTEECEDHGDGQCNNEVAFTQAKDADNVTAANHDLAATGRTVAACVEFLVAKKLSKLVDCILKTASSVHRWSGYSGGVNNCPDYNGASTTGEKKVAYFRHDHPFYEDVRVHSCNFCRCEVGCSGRFSNIQWTAAVTRPRVIDKRGAWQVSTTDIYGNDIPECQSKLVKSSGLTLDYSSRRDNIYKTECQTYCQNTANRNCQLQVSPTSMASRQAWGWCAAPIVSASAQTATSGQNQREHTACLTQNDYPPLCGEECKWGCHKEGDPWNYSVDGAEWDCDEDNGNHVSFACHPNNETEIDDGRSDTETDNRATGMDNRDCYNYRCDGSSQCADGSSDCGHCDDACDCLEVCDDGLDNDRNGDTDCHDSVCSPNCGCTDPVADNYDSSVLYDDGSCTFPEMGFCDDGVDNDDDGDTDCDDSDCAGDPACMETGQCDDGLDNDGDGDVDCDDSDCAGEPECMEMGQCDDGVDNDGDGDTDCDDSDCAGDPACTEMGQCDDRVDNDGDGDTDCDDSDCAGDPACMDMGTPDVGPGPDPDAGVPDAEPPIDMEPGPDPDAGVPDAEPALDAEMAPMGCVYEDYRCTPGTTVGLDRCHEDGNGQVTWISVPRESDCSSFPSYRCRNSNDNPGPGESYGAYCTER